ncbi:uncharacterized protein LOC107042828 [Diachasma alloeum]|uniref:uncharacterized protein LOC107042828 n=1 Tax=Diachasma alloeum TaxID=454923 RepID=UPI00073844F8|nr:uncharacterized protein LOC107042828 [Diachasma alloeum]
MSFPYREAVGSLLYLAGATKSDISYAVNVLSRQQVNPTIEDWGMVKRVFRYLKGTINLKLRYTGESEEIESFSDASFVDCKDSLTTCGFLAITRRSILPTKLKKDTGELRLIGYTEVVGREC